MISPTYMHCYGEIIRDHTNKQDHFLWQDHTNKQFISPSASFCTDSLVRPNISKCACELFVCCVCIRTRLLALIYLSTPPFLAALSCKHTHHKHIHIHTHTHVSMIASSRLLLLKRIYRLDLWLPDRYPSTWTAGIIALHPAVLKQAAAIQRYSISLLF